MMKLSQSLTKYSCNGMCNQCSVPINGGTCPKNHGIYVVQDFARSDAIVCDRDIDALGIAVDIGTTTLVFALYELKEGRHIATYSLPNSQRTLGADVITRIKNAMQGKYQQLHDTIIKDIHAGITHILKNANGKKSDVAHMVITGNTTMLHIINELPIDSLGVAPFTPVDINKREIYLSFLPNCNVVTLPCISAFIGADVVTGIVCASDLSAKEKTPADTWVLVDLGTNGEICLKYNNTLWVSATAAGPAFEAGNISHGVAAIPGAITSIDLAHPIKMIDYETINNEPAIGICGTGVIEITAELIAHHMVDETGRLDPRYHGVVEIAPQISFTQGDIREVQLAKSAIRTGIDILLKSAGCEPDEVQSVYLAGGFSSRLILKHVLALGMFPAEFEGKIATVGNTALGGAVMTLLSSVKEAEMELILSNTTEVNLATHPLFNDLFASYISFPE